MLVDLSNSLAPVLETIRSSATEICKEEERGGEGRERGRREGEREGGRERERVLWFSLTISASRMSACSGDSLCKRPFSYVHNIDLTNSAETFAVRLQSV